MVNQLDVTRQFFYCKQFFLIVKVLVGHVMQLTNLSYNTTKKSGCIMQLNSCIIRLDSYKMWFVQTKANCNTLDLGVMLV